MPILNVTSSQAGLTGVLPAIAYINTNDTEAQVLATGYLNQAVESGLASFSLPCICCVSTVNTVGALPDVGWYELSFSANNWSLLSTEGAAPVVFPVTTTSATPGTIRAVTGKVTETATTMTSGNLVGVRGEVDYVGASAGFIYGVQGKLIPTGTLSGSSWSAPVFAQFDLSHATINAGQTAPVWADYGATGGTFTDATGMRMFSGTNTISTLTLFAMDYRYGKATNLLELDGSSSTYISTGGATASGTIKKIAISIDGVQYYLQAATVYS